jgi:hypothetical protein
MAAYLENVLKSDYVSRWKHSLEKFRVSFDTASRADLNEETGVADSNEKTGRVDWKVDFKEKLGGWWW